jgi:hypothetical protein
MMSFFALFVIVVPRTFDACPNDFIKGAVYGVVSVVGKSGGEKLLRCVNNTHTHT